MIYTQDQKETGVWIREITEASTRGWKAFYHTHKWRKKREEILKRDRHSCQVCRSRGKYTRANTVHHIRHLKDEPELALTDENLVSLCASCHEDMHPEFRYKAKGFQNEERW